MTYVKAIGDQQKTIGDQQKTIGDQQITIGDQQNSMIKSERLGCILTGKLYLITTHLWRELRHCNHMSYATS